MEVIARRAFGQREPRLCAQGLVKGVLAQLPIGHFGKEQLLDRRAGHFGIFDVDNPIAVADIIFDRVDPAVSQHMPQIMREHRRSCFKE